MGVKMSHIGTYTRASTATLDRLPRPFSINTKLAMKTRKIGFKPILFGALLLLGVAPVDAQPKRGGDLEIPVDIGKDGDPLHLSPDFSLHARRSTLHAWRRPAW